MSKVVKSSLSGVPKNTHGLGIVRADFTASISDYSIFDTRVDLIIEPFAITWADREKLVDELQAVIDKYLI